MESLETHKNETQEFNQLEKVDWLFPLTVGRQEVWVLQAPSRDIKETWITEVKRVLLNQFHQLKGQTQQTSRNGSHVINTSVTNLQKMSQHSGSISNETASTLIHK